MAGPREQRKIGIQKAGGVSPVVSAAEGPFPTFTETSAQIKSIIQERDAERQQISEAKAKIEGVGVGFQKGLAGLTRDNNGIIGTMENVTDRESLIRATAMKTGVEARMAMDYRAFAQKAKQTAGEDIELYDEMMGAYTEEVTRDLAPDILASVMPDFSAVAQTHRNGIMDDAAKVEKRETAINLFEALDTHTNEFQQASFNRSDPLAEISLRKVSEILKVMEADGLIRPGMAQVELDKIENLGAYQMAKGSIKPLLEQGGYEAARTFIDNLELPPERFSVEQREAIQKSLRTDLSQVFAGQERIRRAEEARHKEAQNATWLELQIDMFRDPNLLDSLNPESFMPGGTREGEITETQVASLIRQKTTRQDALRAEADLLDASDFLGMIDAIDEEDIKNLDLHARQQVALITARRQFEKQLAKDLRKSSKNVLMIDLREQIDGGWKPNRDFLSQFVVNEDGTPGLLSAGDVESLMSDYDSTWNARNTELAKQRAGQACVGGESFCAPNSESAKNIALYYETLTPGGLNVENIGHQEILLSDIQASGVLDSATKQRLEAAWALDPSDVQERAVPQDTAGFAAERGPTQSVPGDLDRLRAMGHFWHLLRQQSPIAYGEITGSKATFLGGVADIVVNNDPASHSLLIGKLQENMANRGNSALVKKEHGLGPNDDGAVRWQSIYNQAWAGPIADDIKSYVSFPQEMEPGTWSDLVQMFRAGASRGFGPGAQRGLPFEELPNLPPEMMEAVQQNFDLRIADYQRDDQGAVRAMADSIRSVLGQWAPTFFGNPLYETEDGWSWGRSPIEAQSGGSAAYVEQDLLFELRTFQQEVGFASIGGTNITELWESGQLWLEPIPGTELTDNVEYRVVLNEGGHLTNLFGEVYSYDPKDNAHLRMLTNTARDLAEEHPELADSRIMAKLTFMFDMATQQSSRAGGGVGAVLSPSQNLKNERFRRAQLETFQAILELVPFNENQLAGALAETEFYSRENIDEILATEQRR
jgi:hypothetical protein